MTTCVPRWKAMPMTPTADVPPLYLGIDGGGSKTLAIVVDAAGTQRGCGLAGSANHEAVSLATAVANIHAAATVAMSQAGGVLPAVTARIGLAGIDRPDDHALLAPYLRELADEIILTNDAALLLSALPDSVGVALIAGTGAIACGRNAQGVTVRASGWGHIIGDEGSGYELGRLGMQAAIRAADGRGATTTLLDSFLAHWHLTDPADMMGPIYADDDKSRIASLSHIVLTAATDGDKVARRIVQSQAGELAKAVQVVTEKLGFSTHVPLALGGGLLIHDDYYRALVLKRLRRHFPELVITLVPEPALSAALAARPS